MSFALVAWNAVCLWQLALDGSSLFCSGVRPRDASLRDEAGESGRTSSDSVLVTDKMGHLIKPRFHHVHDDGVNESRIKRTSNASNSPDETSEVEAGQASQVGSGESPPRPRPGAHLSKEFSCGGHKVPDCSKCIEGAPKGTEPAKCNGDCEWFADKGVCGMKATHTETIAKLKKDGHWKPSKEGEKPPMPEGWEGTDKEWEELVAWDAEETANTRKQLDARAEALKGKRRQLQIIAVCVWAGIMVLFGILVCLCHPSCAGLQRSLGMTVHTVEASDKHKKDKKDKKDANAKGPSPAGSASSSKNLAAPDAGGGGGAGVAQASAAGGVQVDGGVSNPQTGGIQADQPQAVGAAGLGTDVEETTTF